MRPLPLVVCLMCLVGCASMVRKQITPCEIGKSVEVTFFESGFESSKSISAQLPLESTEANHLNEWLGKRRVASDFNSLFDPDVCVKGDSYQINFSGNQVIFTILNPQFSVTSSRVSWKVTVADIKLRQELLKWIRGLPESQKKIAPVQFEGRLN
ncbi:MAG: hypothetical protein FD138_1272 [Planctomycetota bacterium]|nr:MAG: hypothetical protein FD138_1272 [Planctomycetota bacterium]